MVNSLCNRLLVVGCLAHDTRRALPIAISDNKRASQLCGWLFGNTSGDWESQLRCSASTYDSLSGSLGLIDNILDLEFLKQNPEFNIAEGYNLLVIGDSSCDVPDFQVNICNTIKQLRPNTGPEKIYTLHIGSCKMKDDASVNASFHAESNTESGSVVNYEGEEWASLIVQLVEFLIVTRDVDQKAGDQFALGYSNIGLNMTVGRNFLAAKAKDWVLERELREIDLDETLGNVNPLIRKYSNRFGELVKQQGHPPCDDLLGQVGIMNPSTVNALDQYVSRVKDSDLLTDIDTKLGELVREIEDSITTALDEVNTVTERRALAQAISGRFPDSVSGKPLRDWETIYRLYDEPLMRLSEFGVNAQELEELALLKEALESAKDVNYEIGECKGEIYRATELGKPTEKLENRLKELNQRLSVLKVTSIEVADRCRANFKKLFAQVDKELLSTRVKQLIEEAQYEPPPPPPPLEPVFAPWVVRRMLYTVVPALLWLIAELKWDLLHLGAAIAVFHIVALVWIVVIAKRLNRKKPQTADVETPIRNKFRSACSQIAELYITTRALQKFNRLMESGILFTLEKEMQDLNTIVDELTIELGEAKKYQRNAFPEISSEVSLTDRKSYERYFSESLLPELPDYPYLFDDKDRMDAHRSRKSVDVVSNYTEAVMHWSASRSEELTKFQMFHYLLDENNAGRPAFLRSDLPSVDRLMRDAKLNMSVLHSAKVNEQKKIYVFRYASEKENYLVERFGSKLNKEFEESVTGNLFHIDTTNANRIGFLTLKRLNK